MSSELLPCPFCGGEATSVDNGIYESWFAVCLECDATTGYYDTEQEAIAAWNTRAERTCKNVDDECGAWFTCSQCGETTSTEWFCAGYGAGNYCPNCGARVVGD